MNFKQKISILILGITGLSAFSFVFQNCAKTNYKTLGTASSQNATSTNLTKRKITVDPSFNPVKADMKVLFVVDDSFTMSQSQAHLANALDSLLNPLLGHNVEFKIVSTSGIPSNEIDFNVTTKYFSDQNIELSAIQITGLNSYIIEKNMTTSSNKRHAPLKLFRESTTSQFTNLKADIKKAIQDVGVIGSDTEEGLCSTARQLFDDTTSRFFKPGDKAAIVILTDENDSSVFSKCSRRYRQRVSNAPVVYYNYGQQRAKISLEYQVIKDGVSSWSPINWGVSLSGERSITVGAACSVADQNEALNRITSQGFNVRNITKCVYEIEQASYYGADLGDDGSDPNKNLCQNSFNYLNGIVYPNLYNMVNSNGFSIAANSCSKQIVPGNSLSAQMEFDSVIKSDSVASAAQDLKLSIANKSNELFGSSGFFISSLIRINTESCSLASGQSYGTKYQELTDLLGPQKSIVQSLCYTDFSTTLSKVSQFIVNEAEKSYSLPVQDGETVLSVTLINGSSRKLLTASDYEAVKGVVTLSNFNLIKGDTLEVELGPK